MLLVVDVDCTIANGAARVAKAGPEPSRDDKEAYVKWVETVNSGVESDLPVPGMKTLLESLAGSRAIILYLTSREEKLRNVTKHWLFEHGFPSAPLFMRPNDCWMSTAELKEIAISLFKQGQTEVVVLDDDEHGTIEEMCKRRGFTFLKARSGGQR